MADYRLPPRQKMINLVYIILIAMLAINISADTLDTYFLLDKGLQGRITELDKYRDSLSRQLASEFPEASHDVQTIDSMATGLLDYIDAIKEDIARAADKKKYTSANELKASEELNAVPDVMLSAVNPRASYLRRALADYRDSLEAKLPDISTKNLISSYLDIEHDKKLTSWEKETFTSMPAIGGMVYMNTLKENILHAGIEAYRGLMSSFYVKDTVRHEADARYVLVNNDQMVVARDGTIEVPVVNVTPHIESVIYAGLDNLVDVLAIGITPDQMDIEVSGGTYRLRNGKLYLCPDEASGEFVLKMSCIRNGERKDLGTKTFHIKQLPTPAPYVIFDGGTIYSGNVPIGKDMLKKASSIGASINDPVHVEYDVLGFEMVLIRRGDKGVLSARSEGSVFTPEQKRILASAENGDKIYFTGIRAGSPNGQSVYQLPPVSAPVYE